MPPGVLDNTAAENELSIKTICGGGTWTKAHSDPTGRKLRKAQINLNVLRHNVSDNQLRANQVCLNTWRDRNRWFTSCSDTGPRHSLVFNVSQQVDQSRPDRHVKQPITDSHCLSEELFVFVGLMLLFYSGWSSLHVTSTVAVESVQLVFSFIYHSLKSCVRDDVADTHTLKSQIIKDDLPSK